MRHTSVTMPSVTQENPVEFTDAPGFTRQWSQVRNLPRLQHDSAAIAAETSSDTYNLPPPKNAEDVGDWGKEKTHFRHSGLVERLWPTCAICARPVERMRIYRSAVLCQMVLRAECHGETEETVLTDEFLAGLERFESLRGGAAFGRKLLLRGEP